MRVQCAHRCACAATAHFVHHPGSPEMNVNYNPATRACAVACDGGKTCSSHLAHGVSTGGIFGGLPFAKANARRLSQIVSEDGAIFAGPTELKERVKESARACSYYFSKHANFGC